MAYDFDLKKFLAQNANTGHDELGKALDESQISRYLDEVQSAGMKIISNHMTDKEANMMVAMCIGQVTHFTMKSDPTEVPAVMSLLTQHKDLLFTLIATAVACGVGMGAKEEWV